MSNVTPSRGIQARLRRAVMLVGGLLAAAVMVGCGDPSPIIETGKTSDPGETTSTPTEDRLVFTRLHGNLELYTMYSNGTGQGRLTTSLADERHAEWSPDGSRIVYEADDRLWVMNADGSGVRALTPKNDRGWVSAWAPDGGTIAYTTLGRSGRGDSKIHFVRADGQKAELETIDPGLSDDLNDIAWSPNGKRLAFTGSDLPPGEKYVPRSDVYTVRVDGSRLRKLTDTRDQEYDVDWSVKNELVFYRSFVRNEKLDESLVTISADGSNERDLKVRGTAPAWSPDGTEIAYEDRNDIFVIGRDGTGKRQLTRFDGRDPDWVGPTVTITVDPTAEVVEGDAGSASAIFELKLNRPSKKRVGVRFATLPESASAGEDYVLRQGRRVFQPGETRARVKVLIQGDSRQEGEETFVLKTLVDGAVPIDEGPARVTIIDDDQPQVSVAEVSVTEGGAASFEVTLSKTPARNVLVRYVVENGSAQSGSDFEGGGQGVLVIPAGERTGFIREFPIIDDDDVEGSEVFLLKITSVEHAQLPGEGPLTVGAEIVDNDEPLPPPTGGGGGGGGHTPSPPSVTNGRIVYSRSGQIYTMNPDGSDKEFVTYGGDPSWSPDGSRIVFYKSGGQHDLYGISPDGTGEFRITNDVTAETHPVWGPNSLIAFTAPEGGADLEIVTIRTDGTGRAPVTNNSAQDQEPSWASDGTLVYRSDADGDDEIYLQRPGAAAVQLTNNTSADISPDISLDGTKVAFISSRDGNFEVYSVNADGTHESRLTAAPSSEYFPSWSPDGTQIAFATDRDGNREIYRMRLDGSPATNLTQNADATFGHDDWPDWGTAAVTTPPPVNGKIAFTRDDNIITADPDGTDEQVVAPGSDPAWSPDGTQIAFRLFTNATSGEDLYIVDMAADGSAAGTPTQLTSSGGHDYEPEWSPDGTRLVFERDDDIWVVNVATGVETVVGAHPDLQYNPSWSPDGTKIVYQHIAAGGSQIWVVNADGSSPTNLSGVGVKDHDPEWSRDGTQIVFTSDRDGDYEIYRMAANGSSQTQMTSNSADDFQPTWSPDGTSIAFVSDRLDAAAGTCGGSCDLGVYTMPNVALASATAVDEVTTGYVSGPHWGTLTITP